MNNYLEHKTPLSCPHLLPNALARSVGGQQSRLLHPVLVDALQAGPCPAAVAVALGSAPCEERRLNSEPKAEVHGKS